MIISNKKLRLIIITLLLLIFCFFIGIFKPKAMEIYSHTLNCQNNLSNTQDFICWQGTWNDSSILNKSGYLIFNITVETYNHYNVLKGITIQADGNYQCEFGNSSTYSNYDGSYLTSYSVSCPIQTGNQGIKMVYVSQVATAGTQWNSSLTMSFLTDTTASASDINSIISTNSYYTQEVIKDKINEIKSIISSGNQTQQNIQNNTSDIKDSINDSNIDSNNASSSASTWNSKNATNGTITQLLTLPITLLQAIVNGLQTSCSSFSLGSLFNTNIVLPCINVGALIGSGLWTTIDILFSGFMILSISKKLIKIFNDFTNLKSNQIDELYGGGSK